MQQAARAPGCRRYQYAAGANDSLMRVVTGIRMTGEAAILVMMRALPIAVLLAAAAVAQPTVPGTQPLAMTGDAAMQMLDGIHAYLDGETVRAREARRGRMPDREVLRRI